MRTCWQPQIHAQTCVSTHKCLCLHDCICKLSEQTRSQPCHSRHFYHHIIIALAVLVVSVLIVPVVEMSQPICQTYVIIQNTNFMDPTLIFLIFLKLTNLNDALKHVAWMHCSNAMKHKGKSMAFPRQCR